VADDIIYIWYSDRLKAIQCSHFNFIHDIHRFLLLYVMQRLPYAQWDYHSIFKLEPGKVIEVEDEEIGTGTIGLKFNFNSPDRTARYDLCGRATNVLPAESDTLSRLVRQFPTRNETVQLVTKLYWQDEPRQSEAEILKEVHKIVTEEPKVKDHVPDVIWSHTFKGPSTVKIRRVSEINNGQGGSRALYIIIFRKLRPITQLSGDNFLRAWWHAVECKCSYLHSLFH
jgi:hypothetical protein